MSAWAGCTIHCSSCHCIRRSESTKTLIRHHHSSLKDSSNLKFGHHCHLSSEGRSSATSQETTLSKREKQGQPEGEKLHENFRTMKLCSFSREVISYFVLYFSNECPSRRPRFPHFSSSTLADYPQGTCLRQVFTLSTSLSTRPDRRRSLRRWTKSTLKNASKRDSSRKLVELFWLYYFLRTSIKHNIYELMQWIYVLARKLDAFSEGFLYNLILIWNIIFVCLFISVNLLNRPNAHEEKWVKILLLLLILGFF